MADFYRSEAAYPMLPLLPPQQGPPIGVDIQTGYHTWTQEPDVYGAYTERDQTAY